jgi:hypothetical protein
MRILFGAIDENVDEICRVFRRPDLLDVVGIFGRNQQVNVDRMVALRRGRQPQIVREDQTDVEEPACDLEVEHFGILIDAAIVGNSECLDRRGGTFEPGQVLVPRVLAKLIVHGSARRVDMRIPPPPDRPAWVNLGLPSCASHPSLSRT